MSTYSNVNGTAYIGGYQGPYNGKVQDSSVAYGKNAFNNFWGYHVELAGTPTKDAFEPQKLPPIPFFYKYAPNKDDKMALLAAAYEEMGKKVAIPVAQLTALVKQTFGPKMSGDAPDVNHDGFIDIGEYAAALRLDDMLSKDTTVLKDENVTGEINNQGLNNSMAYYIDGNYKVAHETFSAIHKNHNLQDAYNFFISNPNNLV